MFNSNNISIKDGRYYCTCLVSSEAIAKEFVANHIIHVRTIDPSSEIFYQGNLVTISTTNKNSLKYIIAHLAK